MKAKKFLKIIKKSCTDANCETSKCPMARKTAKGHTSCLMLAAESVPCDWDIPAIIAAAKNHKRGRGAKTNG